MWKQELETKYLDNKLRCKIKNIYILKQVSDFFSKK